MPPKLNPGAGSSRPSASGAAAARPPSSSNSGAAAARPPSSSRPSASGAAVLFLERPHDLQDRGAVRLERPRGLQDRGAIRLERPRDLDDIGAIKRKRSQVEGTGTGAVVVPVVALGPVFGPDTLETAMEKKEMAQINARKKLNEKRVVEAFHPFRLEYNIMKRRGTRLIRLVERVDRQLSALDAELRRFAQYPSNHVKKRDIAQLRDIYMLERLQKEEEIMRIGDRMEELRIIIRNIYRQYEIDPDHVDEMLRNLNGGTQKQNRSLKYGRNSSNGRYNLTKRR